MDASMWDEIPASEGLTAEAAKPKGNRAADAPTQQPMKAGLKPAQQRKPTGDQKRHRRQMARQASDATYGPQGYRTLACAKCRGAVAGDYHAAECVVCGATYNPLDKADATALGLREDEVIRLSLGGHYVVAVPMTSVMASKSSTPSTSTSSTHTKESTAMTQQPTEADLIQRLASATTLVQQTAISEQLEALRTAQRESASMEGTLDWGSMVGVTAPSHMQAVAASLAGIPEDDDAFGSLLPPMTASTRLGHTDATDWMADLTPTHTLDATLSTVARAEATRWFENVYGPVKQDAQEFSTQAHNAAVRDCSKFALQSTAARSVYLDQIKHLASREGISLVAFEETVDTYVSDGKTTQPVGVGAKESEGNGSMDEWTIGTDLNGGEDPKSTNAEAPSLKEGDTPEGDKAESVDNPNFGEGPDKSEWAVGNTDDKMSTQGGLVMRLASVRTAGIDVSKVRIENREDNTFSGEKADGSRVTFRLSDSDAKDVRSVMFGDLAQNFSGLTIEESDIVTTASRTASFDVDAHMASTFGGYGTGIRTLAQEEQSGAADGLSSADAATPEAPSMQEGDAVEGDHAEAPTQNNGEGAKDLSSATDSDRPGGGVEWGSTAAMRPAPQHSLASIGSVIASKATGNVGIFGNALSRSASLNDSVGGVSIRRVASSLVGNATLPLNIRLALNEHLALETAEVSEIPDCDVCKHDLGKPGVPAAYDGATVHGPWAYMCEQHMVTHGVGLGMGRGQRLVVRSSKTASATCSVCGDAIAKDAEGEDNSTWHHDNGEKHDHEAKPGGDEGGESSESKEGRRAPFAREAAESPEGWWPRNRPDDVFPGEMRLGCPKCGGPAIIEGTPGPSGIQGMPGGGTTLICKDCGNRAFFPKEAKTAAEYAGGSPKHGDTAKCHADGLPIEFFDGQWYHYSGGPSHNDVHPGTPREIADGTAMGSKQAAQRVQIVPVEGSGGECSVPGCGKTATFVATAKFVGTSGDQPACNSHIGDIAGNLAKQGSRRTAGEVPEGFKQNWSKGDGDDADTKDESGEGKPWEKESSRTALFRSRVQANLSRVAGGDFSLSDAQNEEGEWIMSPEQIRAEMNYEPDPYDEYEDDGWHEGAKRASRKTALEAPEGYETGTCRTCGADIVGKGGKWVHDPREGANRPVQPDNSVASEAHAVVPA